MQVLKFTKMQGVGNDFVVVDGRGQDERDWSGLALRVCDRHTGVGADGLLVLDDTPSADFLMRMYNPDGTPDVCGNGLRCLARYASEQGIVMGDEMRVLTLAGVRAARLLRDAQRTIYAVTVDMGQPGFAPGDIPMQADINMQADNAAATADNARVIDYPLPLPGGEILPVTALSTGSAHAVAFVESLPDDATFFRVSPLVETHVLFPERISLMWCAPDGPNRLRLRIWERGAGDTWGCGPGACAAAVAAVLHNHVQVGQSVRVVSKGGELVIRWQPGSDIEMTGPACVVYEGQI